MTIILDAMGSDDYPGPEIQGALDAARDFGEEIILVGNEELIGSRLAELNKSGLPVRIVHAPDVLEMTDKPVDGARKKPLNSMAVGLELVKTGQGSAFVTAGNTGGAMFNGLRTLGRIKGVQRPGLTAVFPTKTGFCAVVDIGANADCRPEFLVQFAIMGSLYAEKLLNIAEPRVGLLSNGEESMKGNQLVKDTFPLLQTAPINFIGNVEAKELFQGKVDVVVTDGFTGNVLLKSSEAVARLLIDSLKKELTSKFIYKLGAALAKPAFGNLKKMMEPEEIGAAPLLGIDGLVFVGHGRSNARAIYSAIRIARQAVQSDLLEAMRGAIQSNLSSPE
ncbi:MAG: phosphate acyltransferase PlsX [Anaerolineaceae bacterium]|nr:phosphate acyltransferase PlsX [Anaerolineaceae bacterium]